jgi:hypothetical protein
VAVEKKNMAECRARASEEERAKSMARYGQLIQLVDAYTRHGGTLGSISSHAPPTR